MENKFIQGLSKVEFTKLPAIIKLTQFDNDWFVNKKETVYDDLRDRKGHILGSLGKGYMDMVVDFTCMPIEPGSDEDPFKDINNIIIKTKFPSFRNSYFSPDKYIILEISDLSHEAMSPGFADFVPHVYYNGRKIWQKYVGIIKQYSTRKAWVIIIKDNNLNGLEDINWESTNSFSIRCVSKINLEKKVNNESKKEDDLKDYLNLNIHDYDIVFNQNSKLKVLKNTRFLLGFNILLSNDINENDRFKNTAISLDEQKGIQYDSSYYRQSLINDYIDGTDIYNREFTASFTFENFGDEIENNEMRMRTKQTRYNAVYIKGNNLVDSYKYGGSDLDHNIYTVYNSAGEVINLSANPSYGTSEYEVISEFDSRRKFGFYGNSLSSDKPISQILYDNYIFPYNIESAEYIIFSRIDPESDSNLNFIFKESGFSGTLPSGINATDIVFIYESNYIKDDISITEPSGDTYTHFDKPTEYFSRNSDNINYNNYSNYLDPYGYINTTDEEIIRTGDNPDIQPIYYVSDIKPEYGKIRFSNKEIKLARNGDGIVNVIRHGDESNSDVIDSSKIQNMIRGYNKLYELTGIDTIFMKNKNQKYDKYRENIEKLIQKKINIITENATIAGLTDTTKTTVYCIKTKRPIDVSIKNNILFLSSNNTDSDPRILYVISESESKIKYSELIPSTGVIFMPDIDETSDDTLYLYISKKNESESLTLERAGV